MVALVAASSSTSGLTERRGISAAVFVKNCSDELTPNLPIKKDIEFMEKRIEDLEKSMKGSNESEEMQKKTGYIVLRAEGIFDVDANTSIDQLSDELEIKMPEEFSYGDQTTPGSPDEMKCFSRIYIKPLLNTLCQNKVQDLGGRVESNDKDLKRIKQEMMSGAIEIKAAKNKSS
ncbi:PREDICTED: uncharacterized protein LOC109148564 [Ipomoea nil]|uniref:uncharacterized protein LOC109148564 n=1 Tax=Ipomoea nil TaxID=35883 RepID=UPI0009016B85|nr:PREDICTED: uncharacterized protein LOC109148564 [Ipomoea nil]